MVEQAQATDTATILGLLRGLMQGARPEGDVLGLMQRLRLTLPQLLSLSRMQQGPQTVGGLAADLGLTPGAVSRLVDQLVAQRLVRRAEGSADRRRKELSLSPSGERTLAQLDAAREAGLGRLLRRLDPELRAELAAVLQRVAAAVHPLPPTHLETTP